MKLYLEVRNLELIEILEAIHQCQRVLVEHIEWIALESLFESRLACFFLTDPQLVHTKLAHCTEIARIQPQTFTRKIRGLLIKAQFLAVIRHRYVQRAVCRIDLENPRDLLLELWL